MQQRDKKSKHQPTGQITLPTTAATKHSEATPNALPASETHKHSNHHCRHSLTPKQLLHGADICSRFEQVCGKGAPKRMTTGKFVYLGPSDRLPDNPL